MTINKTIGNKYIGIASALVSSGTFGMIPLFTIPLITTYGMAEPVVLFYRYVISTLALAAMCRVNNVSLRVPTRLLLRLGMMSILYAGTGIALVYSYNYISSGIVTTLHFLYPVVVSLLMILFYKEKLSLPTMFATLVTIAGVAALSWTGRGTGSVTGFLLALSTAFTYAFYIVGLNHSSLRSLDSRVIIFYVMLFGILIFGLLAAFTGNPIALPVGNAWIYLIALALLPTIISNLTLIKAVKYAGATTTSILGSAEPLVAVLLGVLVFSERLSFTSLIGMGLIVLAVTYSVKSRSKI